MSLTEMSSVFLKGPSAVETHVEEASTSSNTGNTSSRTCSSVHSSGRKEALAWLLHLCSSTLADCRHHATPSPVHQNTLLRARGGPHASHPCKASSYSGPQLGQLMQHCAFLPHKPVGQLFPAPSLVPFSIGNNRSGFPRRPVSTSAANLSKQSSGSPPRGGEASGGRNASKPAATAPKAPVDPGDEPATAEELAAFAQRLVETSDGDISVAELRDVYDINRADENPLRLSREVKKARKLRLRGVDRELFRCTVPVPPDVDVKVEGTRFFFDGPLGSNAFDLIKADSNGMAAFKVLQSLQNTPLPCFCFRVEILKLHWLCLVGTAKRLL
jgi:hypothetical protein